jgi:hypothetical protein
MHVSLLYRDKENFHKQHIKSIDDKKLNKIFYINTLIFLCRKTQYKQG